eukprot:2835047-Rhodomonas_salina.1
MRQGPGPMHTLSQHHASPGRESVPDTSRSFKSGDSLATLSQCRSSQRSDRQQQRIRCAGTGYGVSLRASKGGPGTIRYARTGYGVGVGRADTTPQPQPS